MCKMLNVVWLLILVFSILFSLFTGQVSSVAPAATRGAANAVQLCITLAAVYVLWGGLMEVAREVGLLSLLARLVRPLVGRLFPSTKTSKKSEEALVMNLAADILGLGNAATPAGQQAMQALADPTRPGYATNEMVRLVVLNNCAITLLPTTVLSLRAAAGSLDVRFLPVSLAVSVVSTLVGLLVCWLMERRKRA